jgi:hypothetical protein
MPNPAQNAYAVSRRSQKRTNGVTVTLKRGEATSLEITAVWGNTRGSVVSENSFEVEVKERDYLIDVDDYDFGTGPVRPLDGDLIIETIGKATLTHEVLPLVSDKSWSWSDPGRTVYRVHTKQIETDDE